jgi:hypothetical protein
MKKIFLVLWALVTVFYGLQKWLLFVGASNALAENEFKEAVNISPENPESLSAGMQKVLAQQDARTIASLTTHGTSISAPVISPPLMASKERLEDLFGTRLLGRDLTAMVQNPDDETSRRVKEDLQEKPAEAMEILSSSLEKLSQQPGPPGREIVLKMTSFIPGEIPAKRSIYQREMAGEYSSNSQALLAYQLLLDTTQNPSEALSISLSSMHGITDPNLKTDMTQVFGNKFPGFGGQLTQALGAGNSSEPH